MKKLFLFEHLNPGRNVKIKGRMKNLVGCGIYNYFRCGPVIVFAGDYSLTDF
jgi:hypothetical protein